MIVEPVKDEPESPAGPCAQSCNPFIVPSSSFSDSRTNVSEPLWKQCGTRNRVKQVQINETAAEHSREFLEGATKVLREYGDKLSSCDTRLKEISAIKNRKRECEVRIGFLGNTGTGKSSLINALLQMKVLPRNEEAASTAVAVEVSYNHSDDPNRLFLSEIEGISKSEFSKELEDLFEDKRQWDLYADDEDEDEERDTEIWQRMLNTIEKIKWLYPSLKNPDDLNKTSAKQLLSKPHVLKMLDSKKRLLAKTEAAFAKDIKKYIESTAPKEGDDVSVSLWPLVKVVRIFVKAEILKPGIILVDLPGSGDTSAARVAVSENYRKNLTASIVCAPAPRAGDDKAASDLLMSSVQRRNMQLDGTYSSDSLFFVITQTDRLSDYRAYIRDHENLQDSNQQDLETIDAKTVEIEEKKKELAKRGAKKLKLDEMVASMQATYDRLVATTAGAGGRKRKRMNAEAEKEASKKRRELKKKLSEKQDSARQEGSELYDLNFKKQRLEEQILQAKSRVMMSCIQNRAALHANKAQKEFLSGRRMMMSNYQEGSEKPLQVFSVSAEAYGHLVNREREDALKKGFSTTADTGIPALRDAILAMTWPIRQENARSFNEEVEHCLTRLKLWSMDTSSEYKMSDAERVILQSRLDTEIQNLDQIFPKLHGETHEGLLQCIKEGIYQRLPQIAKKSFEIAAKDKVTRDWCLANWNTHRAINKRMGDWKGSNKKAKYDWNEDLSGIYLDLLVKDWAETFHNKCFALLKNYQNQADLLIAEFVDSITASAQDIHKTVNDALQSLRENLLGVKTVLKNAAAEMFERVKLAAKEAHRLVKPEVLSSWESTYATCGAAKGKDVFKRNKETHKKHVYGDGGIPMYKRAGVSMQKTLNKELEKVEEKFQANFDNAVNRIREDLKVMLDRHSLSSTQTGSPEAISLEKVKLQKALKPYFDALERAWGIESENGVDESEKDDAEEASDADGSEVENFNPAEYDDDEDDDDEDEDDDDEDDDEDDADNDDE